MINSNLYLVNVICGQTNVEVSSNYTLYLVNFVVKKTPKQPPAGPDADSEATSDGTKTSATEQGIIHLFFPKRIMWVRSLVCTWYQHWLV